MNKHTGFIPRFLKNKISFPVDENFTQGVFANNNSDKVEFYSINADSNFEIISGEITDEMFALEGLQLYDVPFYVGIFCCDSIDVTTLSSQ